MPAGAKYLSIKLYAFKKRPPKLRRPSLVISACIIFLSRCHPTNKEINSPPIGIINLAEIISKKLKNPDEIAEKTPNTKTPLTIYCNARFLVILNSSSKYAVTTSINDIVEVSAAIASNRKNNDDQIADPGI